MAGRRGRPDGLAAADVGLQVVPHDQRGLGSAAQRLQGCGEERRRGLAQHPGRRPGGVLQQPDPPPGVQVLAVVADRDPVDLGGQQLRPTPDGPEGGVQVVVGRPVAGIGHQHMADPLPRPGQPVGEQLPHPPGRHRQHPGRRVRPEHLDGDLDRGHQLVLGHLEPAPPQPPGQLGRGHRVGVGAEPHGQPPLPQPPHRLGSAVHDPAAHIQRPVQVQQHGLDALQPPHGHLRTIPATPRWRATMPPVRLRHSTAVKPASWSQRARPGWSGQAPMERARYW
jgi:hypothetical protein